MLKEYWCWTRFADDPSLNANGGDYDEAIAVIMGEDGRVYKYEWSSGHQDFPYCYLDGDFHSCDVPCIRCQWADAFLYKGEYFRAPLKEITEEEAEEIIETAIEVDTIDLSEEYRIVIPGREVIE
jgi:hypothetical protein